MHSLLNMTQKTVFQLNRNGFYVGATEADESPLEAGVWLIPAGCVEVSPPTSWPDDEWPRWNGSAWALSNKPASVAAVDPVEKLQAFLSANPDVAAIINT